MTTLSTNITNHMSRYERLRFAVFIKVLLKLIDDKKLRDQAKRIALAGIQQSRQGYPNHPSLIEVIVCPLRGLVGDSLWVCASHYTALYFNRKHRLHESSLRRKRLDIDQQLSNLESLLQRSNRNEQFSNQNVITCREYTI